MHHDKMRGDTICSVVVLIHFLHSPIHFSRVPQVLCGPSAPYAGYFLSCSVSGSPALRFSHTPILHASSCRTFSVQARGARGTATGVSSGLGAHGDLGKGQGHEQGKVLVPFESKKQKLECYELVVPEVSSGMGAQRNFGKGEVQGQGKVLVCRPVQGKGNGKGGKGGSKGKGWSRSEARGARRPAIGPGLSSTVGTQGDSGKRQAHEQGKVLGPFKRMEHESGCHEVVVPEVSSGMGAQGGLSTGQAQGQGKGKSGLGLGQEVLSAPASTRGHTSAYSLFAYAPLAAAPSPGNSAAPPGKAARRPAPAHCPSSSSSLVVNPGGGPTPTSALGCSEGPNRSNSSDLPPSYAIAVAIHGKGQAQHIGLGPQPPLPLPVPRAARGG